MEEHLQEVIEDLPKVDHTYPFARTLQTRQFDYLLLEAIDDTLAGLFGNVCRDQIYDYLARRYRYGREEVPMKIPEFCEFLEKIFSSGSMTIERTILRRLCEKLGCDFSTVFSFDFFNCIGTLRARSAREGQM